MDVYLRGSRISLGGAPLLGKGGEAEVFDLGTRALKVFKTPDHPDLHGDQAQQRAARARLDEHQRKLPRFPPALPPRVVVPAELATDRRGKTILGFAMRKVEHAAPLLHFAQPAFRRTVSANQLLEVFLDLRQTVLGLHQCGVVLGDFNDLNVLVRGGEAELIDADSFQFAGFHTPVFTERFVDPRLLAQGQPSFVLARPFDSGSDWYAWYALLFQSLLLTAPYGGIHRPAQGNRLGAVERAHRRLTVLAPEVQYPKPALPPRSLPDELLSAFDAVLHRDDRQPPSVELLRSLHFARCPTCQLEHARRACPTCQPNAGTRATPAVLARGRVTATVLHASEGLLLHAAIADGRLRFVERVGELCRDEQRRTVWIGPLEPGAQLFTTSSGAWVLQRGSLRSPGPQLARNAAAAAATEGAVFYASAGQLWKVGALGDEPVGAVVEQQTRLFGGPRRGLGLYRAGRVTVVFTFPKVRELELGLRLRGELVAVDAAVGDELAWLRTEERVNGRARLCLRVIGRDGQLLGALDDASEEDWSVPLTHAALVGPHLFLPTDAGLVRAELTSGVPALTRTFPDTEPFVSSATRLLADSQGLIAASDRRIVRLSMT